MNIRTIFFFICTLCLCACSTLPPYHAQPIEYAFDTDTRQTYLGRMIQPLKAENLNLTGYHILHLPLEALAARLHLINVAEKTLDLQYYIWENDKIGLLAVHHLIEAADRGVKVRLLIDDNNSKAMEETYFALDQHPLIEVRLYNPYRFRHYRGLDLIFDLKRMNRRMHNKSFIADHQISLIGGRNMGNQYYHVSDQYQFSDVDVMLVGAASDQIVHSFDEYWNDHYAYPMTQIVKNPSDMIDFPQLKKQLFEHYQQTTVQNYLQLTEHYKNFDQWLNQDIQFNWVDAHVVKDPPNKIRNSAANDELLYTQLAQLIDMPKQQIDIVSAYFVPEEVGTEVLKELAFNDVDVRILTNSFKANDVAIVHAFYAKYREQLLENNIQLYEFLASNELSSETTQTALHQKVDISLKGLSRSSLHTKLMAIDQKQVFIGSYNLDPRSARLNTEIGVLLNSPKLAEKIHQTMDQNLSTYAYQVLLDANQHLQWKLDQKNQPAKIYHKEPKMKWWQSVGLKLISWLPIEGFM